MKVIGIALYATAWHAIARKPSRAGWLQARVKQRIE